MADADDVYNQLSIGDAVKYSSTPRFTDVSCGIVMKVKNTGVDLVLITPGGIDYRRDVWYVDDPRVKKLENLFYRTGLMADRGVFATTESWKLARANIDIAERLLPLVKTLIQRVKALEEQVNGRGPRRLPQGNRNDLDAEDRSGESGEGK